MEAETGLIMKQGLQNLLARVPSLFPETNRCILWMLAGDMGAGSSSSCGQLYNPGYEVLYVTPPHLTNTHNCCCQDALDKEIVLTAVAAEEISRLVPRATLLQGTGRLDLLSLAKKQLQQHRLYCNRILARWKKPVKIFLFLL